MKKVFLILILIACGFCSIGQTLDTLSPENKVRYRINQIQGNRINLLPDGAISNALRDLTDLSSTRIPYVTIAQLRSGKADTSQIVQVLDENKSGFFRYLKSDLVSADDSSFVIVANTRRYIRVVDDFYNTKWLDSQNLENNFFRMINKIGSTPQTVVLSRTIPVTSNRNIPANIKINFQPGAVFDVNTGSTLTIRSAVNEEGQRLFSGEGKVLLLGNTEISPVFWGAKMDGVSDDRDFFVKALNCASASKVSVIIEKPVFLNIMDDVTKPIFINDDIHLIGRGAGCLIVNNKYIPAFVFPLSQNCSFDITIYYDAQYDAGVYGYVEGSTTEAKGTRFNNTTYKEFLIQQRGITFTGSYSPRALTYSSYWAMFALRGANNINFTNLKLIAKGSTPDRFIVWAFKLVSERPRDAVITSTNAGIYTPCTNINFRNVELDGVIMGIQGGGTDISITDLSGKRYSDVQNADGSFVGGYNYNGSGGYWMSPPHLVYLNDDVERLSISNVIDRGIQVGITKARPTVSGYNNTLKIKGNYITVKGLTSYRMDGLGDVLLGSQNVSIENAYSEYNSSIFPTGSEFPSLRFPSDDDGIENFITNFKLANVSFVDVAPISRLFPIGRIAKGNLVTFENVNVTMNDFDGALCGLSVNGDNNDTYCSVNLKNHTSTKEYVFFVNVVSDFRNTGKNNKHEILIKGWRKILNANTLPNLRGKITLTTPSNLNNNQVIARDLSNSMETFQNGILKQETWTRDEIVTAPTNGNSALLSINVPAGWLVRQVAITTITAFDVTAGITSLSVGSTTGGSEYASLIPSTSGTFVKDLTLTDFQAGTNRIIRLNAIGGNFAGIGTAKISFKLYRVTQGE